VLQGIHAVVFANRGVLDVYSPDKRLWCPTGEQLAALDARLERAIEQLRWNLYPLESYSRQYEAVVEGDRKVVRLQLQCRSPHESEPPEFFQGIPLIAGGGRCTGRVVYDPNSDRLERLAFDQVGILLGNEIPQ